ncbi:MAG: heterodisulfide reductase-related iron-sulfur binding cluster [Chloroflexota bacterium]|nr:heterodisulfide reductase-related iron-sulfur binding cluster [Chloroflexota bacterium]
MQHNIPLEQLGPRGEAMAHAVKACVHCGFCLSACPTYKVMGEEMDSPRGRIFLMKEVLEGNLELEETMPYIDRCLGCMACVPACPSGVPYGELLTPFRAYAEARRTRTPLERITRAMVHESLPYPARFRIAAKLGRLAQPLRRFLPDTFVAMLGLLPRQLPAAHSLPPFYPAQGRRRARVALLVGCAQQVLAPEINWATLRVLARNGVEVVIPQGQGCCGSLALHDGEEKRALELASNNLRVFPSDVDAILTNAAGCGSGMREYPLLFAGSAEEELARTFAAKVEDVSLFLDALGLVEPLALPQPLTVAYHDACHLAHAQGVREAPRTLLSRISNLTLLEIPDGELCCGSAGTYNLEQPAIAHELGERKVRNVLATGADAVAMGNIGCMMQIQSHLEGLGHSMPVLHTVQVLDRAYGTQTPS